MALNFDLILMLATAITGVMWSLEVMILRPRRQPGTTCPNWLYQGYDLFPVLLLVWCLRSFVVQPYRVPSGSLLPTIQIGDFIAVDQSAYGYRWPVFHGVFAKHHTPKRGDIALFYWPKNTSYVFIKRVIGLPNDHIVYQQKRLTINGQPAPINHLHVVNTINEITHQPQQVLQGTETLPGGMQHQVYLDATTPAQDGEWVIPPGHYLMMGDNRDNSDDGRYWGFVPDRLLIGRAWRILLSWNGEAWRTHQWRHLIRWSRIGAQVNP